MAAQVGASTRESYAPAAEALAEYATDATPEQLTGVADELLAVAALLRREVRLRRALADTSRSGEDRVGLLRSVLADKASEDALNLQVALVGARWPTPSSLLDGTERLAVDALLAGADRADELAEVEDELFRFGQVVSGDRALAAALSDSTAELSRRAELVRTLLDGKVRPATLRLAELALAGFGGRGFAASMARLVELAARRRDRTVAYVTTAIPLTAEQQERLAARLAALYGRNVSLKIDVDESIIGGARVQVGSDLYDGTVARRLAEARTALVK
jgi:F-type H+-transporting ATPase subunit delta